MKILQSESQAHASMAVKVVRADGSVENVEADEVEWGVMMMECTNCSAQWIEPAAQANRTKIICPRCGIEEIE